jgi:L-asparagine transporter-like permease
LKKPDPFLSRIVILSAVTLISGYIFFYLFPELKIVVFPFIILYFFIITSILHLWIRSATAENPRRFPAYFMGATTIKLMASLAFIVVYALKNPPEAKRFIVIFFVIYLIYTFFETASLLQNQKKKD